MDKQAGTYPGFRSIKRQGVFVLSSRWDASPSQGYPTPPLSSRYPFIHLGVERHCERTRTTGSRDERTNHEATAPPTEKLSFLWQNSMTGVFVCSQSPKRVVRVASYSNVLRASSRRTSKKVWGGGGWVRSFVIHRQ